MNSAIKARKAEVAAVVAAAFPEYRGRTFRVRPTPIFASHGSEHWDGGSRSQFVAIRLADLARADFEVRSPWAGALPSAQIPVGVVVVEHAIFCGKDAGITIYVRPENLGRVLPRLADVHCHDWRLQGSDRFRCEGCGRISDETPLLESGAA